MRAVVLHTYGGPEALTIDDGPAPVPGPDEVLVDIVATALNRADVIQRMGGYPDPRGVKPEIPGMEMSGIVAAVGERAKLWKPGDRVMAIEDGAAIPEVFITAWDALVLQGGLSSGRWALVHAGASGVGTAAIQIAKAIGAFIAVTCSAGKAEACRDLGADLVFERSPSDWAAEARAARPNGFDTVLDVIGGEEINRNLQVVANRGTVVQVGLMGGGMANVNVGLLLAKRAHWVGTTLRPRPIEEKVAVVRRFAAEVLPLFDTGALRPVIHSRYPLERIAEAHAEMEANATVGKV